MNTSHIEAERALEDNRADGHPPVQPHGPSQVHSPHGPERDQATADSLPASDDAVVPESSGAVAACVKSENKELQYRLENASTPSRPLESISINIKEELGQYIGVSLSYQQIGGTGQIELQLYPVDQDLAQANDQNIHSITTSINELTRSHQANKSENAGSGDVPKENGKGDGEAKPACNRDSVPSFLNLQPEAVTVKADVATKRTSNAAPYIKSITIEQVPCSQYSGSSRIIEHIPCPQHGGR
jgi:hypothetical protein